ncbi:hypothetical protein [Sulfurimonas sp.]|uniref:hypothetical protein n=1 Tax=Sulfurimonas sp. TaxID=2022749 RepID=UPI003D10B1DA
MKIVLTLLIFITFFTACVDKNGFDNFHFSLEQEQWENNFISSKIEDKIGFQGTISAVYLNKVFPQKYKENEYFYIALYLKGGKQLLLYTLNSNNSLSVQELTNNNEFQNFMHSSNKWNRYFLVEFAEQKDIDVLSFEAKNETLSSSTMIFKKDE